MSAIYKNEFKNNSNGKPIKTKIITKRIKNDGKPPHKKHNKTTKTTMGKTRTSKIPTTKAKPMTTLKTHSTQQ